MKEKRSDTKGTIGPKESRRTLTLISRPPFIGKRIRYAQGASSTQQILLWGVGSTVRRCGEGG